MRCERGRFTGRANNWCQPALAIILVCLSVATPLRPAVASASESAANDMIDDMIAAAETLHPAEVYQLAAKLLQVEGREDEAVKWFYIGQLRYRFLLRAEQRPGSNEGVLFAALSESVGQPVNRYAFGDVDQLSRQMAAALEWDAAHDNRLTSKFRYSEALAAVRGEMENFRREMLDRKAEIRRLRLENGLSNRDEPSSLPSEAASPD